MLDLTFYIGDLKANNNVELSLIIDIREQKCEFRISNIKSILVKQDLDLFSNTRLNG